MERCLSGGELCRQYMRQKQSPRSNPNLELSYRLYGGVFSLPSWIEGAAGQDLGSSSDSSLSRAARASLRAFLVLVLGFFEVPFSAEFGKDPDSPIRSQSMVMPIAPPRQMLRHAFWMPPRLWKMPPLPRIEVLGKYTARPNKANKTEIGYITKTCNRHHDERLAPKFILP